MRREVAAEIVDTLKSAMAGSEVDAELGLHDE
jgi:hypothetical protein